MWHGNRDSDTRGNARSSRAALREFIRASRVERARFGAYLRWRVEKTAAGKAVVSQDQRQLAA